jgi:hypothetical protein
MNLAQLQQAMRRDLVHGGDAAFAALVGDHPGTRVYRNTYRGQLRECLRDTFAQCWAWLGDAGFDAVANAYIDRHPPTGWTLDAYGDRFAAMLGTVHAQDPEIAELAWLEWALRRAFDGPDGSPVDPALLAQVDWDSARFSFVPTLRLGTMATNAAAIWSALSHDQPPPPATLLPAPATIMVWRHDLAPSFRTLEPGEQRALDLARSGQSFGALCATLAQDLREDHAMALAGNSLAQWLGNGLITAIACGARDLR